MDKETIDKILNDALEFYNSGSYAEASKLWKEVLAADPSNKQAQEGVKMAELLSQQWVDDNSETAGMLKGIQKAEPPPVSGTEEKSEPAERISYESKSRMLVAEGEQLMQSGKYGEAIDRFSRAMVMDESDHRVQQLLNTAREMLEKEQQGLEKKLHSAIELFEKGDFESSEKIFKDILKANPNHSDALFYIDKLRKAKDEIKNIQSISLEKGGDKRQGERQRKPGETKAPEEEPIMVAKPGRQRTMVDAGAPIPALRAKRALSTRIILIIAPIVFLVGGFYLTRYAIKRFYFSNADKNVKTEQTAAGEVNQGVLPQQDAAQNSGAVQALKLTESMAGMKEKVDQAETDVSLFPSRVSGSASSLILDGKNLLNSGRTIEAEKRFKQATILDPVNMEAKQLLEEASKLADEERKYLDRKKTGIQNFNEGEFTEALRIFYRLPEKKKEPIIARYIMNSWYNLGVTYLQAGNIIEAKNAFNEVLNVDPSDSGARKEKELAEWYVNHKIDSAFVTHVEGLKLRRIDH